MHDLYQVRRVRRRTWWHRGWGLCASLLGAGLLAVAISGVFDLPRSVAEERSYLAAESCTPAQALNPHADCLRSVQARVRSTVIIDRGKQQQFTVRLAGSSPVPAELDLYDSGPLLKRLRPGDQVTVTVWHDYAIAIARGGISQESNDTPLDEPEFITGVVLALTALGSFAMFAGGQAVLRARRLAVKGLPVALVPWSKGALVAAACALPAGFIGACWGGPVMVASAWAAMLPGVWWMVRLMERRAKRQSRTQRRAGSSV
ncbi:hypothetical protein [Streptomyces sp. NPDC001070]